MAIPDIQINFGNEEHKETIKSLSTSLANLFINKKFPDQKCGILNTAIQKNLIVDKGLGVSLHVIALENQDGEIKQYVIKKFRTFRCFSDFAHKTQDLFDVVLKKGIGSINEFTMLMNSQFGLELCTGKINKNQKYFFCPDQGCSLVTKKFPIQYNVTPQPKKYTLLNKGDVLCGKDLKSAEQPISEFIIGTIASYLNRQGFCIHFLDVFDFNYCYAFSQHPQPQKVGLRPGAEIVDVEQYIFMERAEYVFFKIIPNLRYNPHITEVLVYAVLQSIACLQTYFGIGHNDLHTANVFMALLTPETVWQGKKLLDYDYFAYKNGKVTAYLPVKDFGGLIPKIADFGLACKYKKPKVYNYSLNGRAINSRQGPQSAIPNFYCPLFDILRFIYQFDNIKFVRDLKQQIATQLNVPVSHLYRQGVDIEGMPNFDLFYNRPDLNAKDLLLNTKLFPQKFFKHPPPSSKILTVSKVYYPKKQKPKKQKSKRPKSKKPKA